MSGSNFGIVGLGTMGRNLALNIESHGYPVAVWNLETDWITDFISKHPGAKFEGTPTFEQFTAALYASAPDHDDDSGRQARRRDDRQVASRFSIEAMCSSTAATPGSRTRRRREAALRPAGIHFVGCGVSGGEEGARFGPSLMPGGSR